MKKNIVGYAVVYIASDIEVVQAPNLAETRADFLHECMDSKRPLIALYKTKKAARQDIERTHHYNVAFYENHSDERKALKIVPVVQHGDWSEVSA